MAFVFFFFASPEFYVSSSSSSCLLDKNWKELENPIIDALNSCQLLTFEYVRINVISIVNDEIFYFKKQKKNFFKIHKKTALFSFCYWPK